MSDDYIATVRIRRPARVTTDDRGRSVWGDSVETVQLQLVSTNELEAILASGDEESRGAIRKVLADKGEGVLARDPATGLFQIISEDDLRKGLDQDAGAPETRRMANDTREPPQNADDPEELSLVSTQMLRKIIEPEAKQPAKRPAAKPTVTKKDRSGGFDPYNSG